MPAPDSVGTADPHDAYKNFRFRVKWDGRYVAGFSKVSGLTHSTQVVSHRSGGDPGTARVSPGQQEYGPVRLEKGVARDPGFVQWANKIWDYSDSRKDSERDPSSSAPSVSLADFRKDILVELYNEAGQKVLAWNIYRGWVSEYSAVPELDGSENAIAIQTMQLENEGWERDTGVKEPQEPSVLFPAS
jgi:phage tail-like protein